MQNERTALAWQRTALSLMAGSALLSRLTFDRLGPFSFVSVLVGMPLGLWVFVESRRRYRDKAALRAGRAMTEQRPSGPVRSREHWAPAMLSVAVAVAAATELAALLI
ncbi:MAG TPA: DUF202 domain-containing protein [Nocardioidaceae bacterium]|nr:DUF202 domain-containing protein [Nocardioidaceae bacterium]